MEGRRYKVLEVTNIMEYKPRSDDDMLRVMGYNKYKCGHTSLYHVFPSMVDFLIGALMGNISDRSGECKECMCPKFNKS